MPGNSFPFAILIRCQPNHFGFFSQFLQFVNDSFFVGRNFIPLCKIIFDINGVIGFGQITYVPVTGPYKEIFSKITFYRFSFSR